MNEMSRSCNANFLADDVNTNYCFRDCMILFHRFMVCDDSTIDDFRGACAVKGNVQVAGRTSSVSTTEMLSTHDVTF